MSVKSTIILSTINARYSHTAFGLRYLKANLHEFEKDCEIMEFSHDLTVQEVAEAIISRRPDVVGLSCYIWNIEDLLRVAEIIKAVLPQTLLIFGMSIRARENNLRCPLKVQ